MGVLLESLLYLVAVLFLVVVVEAVDSCLVIVLGLSFFIWRLLILSTLFLFCALC
jgi:hypothetical protein